MDTAGFGKDTGSLRWTRQILERVRQGFGKGTALAVPIDASSTSGFSRWGHAKSFGPVAALLREAATWLRMTERTKSEMTS